MTASAEFAAGLLTFALGVLAVVVSLRFGRVLISLWYAVALVAESLVIAGLFLDWGYAWYNRTAWDIALNSNIWVALPHGIALMVLTLAALWGRKMAPWSVLLASTQSLSFLPVIFWVQLDTDSSFLSAAPLVSMYLSLLAAFLFLPQACATIPARGSRWWKVAFSPRTTLIEAITSLSSHGFSVSPPATVLESGSATGQVGNVKIELTTRPSLFPPAYALRVLWTFPDKQPPCASSPVPGFATRERFLVTPSSCSYIGLSSRAFAVSAPALWDFLVSHVQSSSRDSVEASPSDSRSQSETPS